MEDLKSIVESLIFVSESPLSVERMRKAIPDAEAAEIREALQTLSEEYEARKGGFVLKEVAGGFQFRTRPEYHEWIKNLIQPNPVRVSRAALETLAIIAYKQPIIRSDVEHIRGVDCGGIIRTLLERKLIRILGRKEIPGRPLIYATTKYFLELFDLKNLRDLPTPNEIDALENLPEETEETGSPAPEDDGIEIPGESGEERMDGTDDFPVEEETDVMNGFPAEEAPVNPPPPSGIEREETVRTVEEAGNIQKREPAENPPSTGDGEESSASGSDGSDTQENRENEQP